jgi:tetratricopeptide (TPR) repeat protein
MKNAFLERLGDLYARIDSEIAAIGINKEENFCGECSRCCHFLYRFPVSTLEIQYILEHYPEKKHPEDFTDFLNGRLVKPDGSKPCCPYCIPEGCSAYVARPMCCRLYGLSPYRPLIEGCVFTAEQEKAHILWRSLMPFFRQFIDLRFEFYQANLDSLKPKTITDHLDRGNIHMSARSFHAARADFEEALRLNPGDPVIYSYLGWLYELQGEIERSLEHYEHALSIDPHDYSTHIKLGFLLHSQSRLEEAHRHYKRALEIDPFNAQAWGNIGLIYVATNQWHEAEMAYGKAIELDPKNAIYHVCLGNVWYAQNDSEKTLAEMKKALKINPAEDIAYLCLGSVYEKKGEIKRAISAFRLFLNTTKDHEKRATIQAKIRSLSLLF